MIKFKNFILIKFFLIFTVIYSSSFADSHNIYDVLELIKKDLKTLEKAVYSESLNGNSNNVSSSNNLDQNSEDVLTRHLLKLTEIEKKSLKIFCQGAAMRFLLTRVFDYLNLTKGALVKIKDPVEYLKRLEFHNSVKDYKDYFF